MAAKKISNQRYIFIVSLSTTGVTETFHRKYLCAGEFKFSVFPAGETRNLNV